MRASHLCDASRAKPVVYTIPHIGGVRQNVNI